MRAREEGVGVCGAEVGKVVHVGCGFGDEVGGKGGFAGVGGVGADEGVY